MNEMREIFDQIAERAEIRRNEERFNLVYRKQSYFCNRCGARVEKMFEGNLIRFEEDHTCNPKDVLKRRVDIMNGEWVARDTQGRFTLGKYNRYNVQKKGW